MTGPAAARARIAQVGPEPDRPGGMAAVIRELLASPLAERYELDVIPTWSTRDPLRRTSVFVRALAVLARWCRGDGERLVHIHTAVRGSIYRKAACVAVARLAGRPCLLHVHAGAGDIDEFVARLGPLRRALLARALGAADAVVSVSAPGAERIERGFGVADVIVIPNAAPKPRPVAGQVGDGAHPRALYMGGFVAVAKGGVVLVQALPALLEAAPEAEVVLAGTGEPPAELAQLARAQERVRWAGWLDPDAKAAQLTRSEVFVMPSLSEGMPIALLEAMAYGKAIVASRVGGIPDIVEDGVEALLVPPSDPDALAAAVARVLGDRELRERLGSAARERARSYDGDAVYDRVAALYDELLARPAK